MSQMLSNQQGKQQLRNQGVQQIPRFKSHSKKASNEHSPEDDKQAAPEYVEYSRRYGSKGPHASEKQRLKWA